MAFAKIRSLRAFRVKRCRKIRSLSTNFAATMPFKNVSPELVSDAMGQIAYNKKKKKANMNRFSLLRASFLLFLATVLVTGCGAAPTLPAADVLSTIVAGTLTAVPPSVQAPTSTPVAATSEPAPTSTPETSGIRYVYTRVDNVNLRVQPGTLFKVSRVLRMNSKLQALGLAPGGRWLNVLNEEGINGWVGIDLVQGGFDGPPLPVVTPKEVITVSGRALDAGGNPVSGIVFAVMQNTLRTDAFTDETGTFYAYLPITAYGDWTVEFISVDCASNSMDAECKCVGGVCGKPDPERAIVTLPQSAPLSFIWK
jgi:hypothetical protein